MKRLLIAGVLLVVTNASAWAGHLHREKEYQDVRCEEAGGLQEVALDDRSRVDCVTDQYAVEVEFAPKWKEAVGQALYYGLKTGKRPAVVLILEEPEESRFLDRLNLVADRYDIEVWTVGPDQLDEVQ